MTLAEFFDGRMPVAIFLAAILILLVPGMVYAYRGNLGRGARHAVVWMAGCLALVGAYAYRNEFASVAERISAELSPAGEPVTIEPQAAGGPRAVRLRRSMHGPFLARTRVNGAELTMIVDTGASSVVLKSADAERAGIDLRTLNYTIAVETANGTTFCAPVRLRQVSVGGITFQNVEALVSKPGNLKESLLGMSFLRRLRSYDFSGDFLTLRS